jgi:septum formation protein
MILAADTIVYAMKEILGKPKDLTDAARMLRLLSGNVHQVYTGVCLVSGEKLLEGTAVTDVLFSRMTQEDIAFYCASGEPLGKAGAYAIQGLGSMFIEEISGSYTNVVGLPTTLVRRMLQDIAYPIFRRE